MYRVELREQQGGGITSFRLTQSGEELLSGPANDLVSYRDSGGLWRLGHEFRGGIFVEQSRASHAPARIKVNARDGVLEIRVDSEFEERPFVRWLWMRKRSPVLRMRVEGSARRGRTITCRFPTRLVSPGLTMDVPGGIVERPAHKLYRPTFWPARSFAHLRDERSDIGLAAFLGGPAAVASDGAGTLEWIALRYAPRETAFHVLPILAHPASGTDPHQGQLDYAVWFTPRGDARRNRLPHHVRRALRAALFGPNEPDLDDLANSVMLVDRDDVQVSALKPAFQGHAVVARLASFANGSVEVRLSCPSRPIRSATLCDAREREICALEVGKEGVVVPMPYALASVLVWF
jgi:alpha-mannosidase